MLVTKPLDLPLLETQLAAAHVVVNGLGTYPVAGGDELHTYGPAGSIVELPPSAVPVVNAHVAPPVAYEFSERFDVSGVIRTTDDTPTAVVAIPTTPKRQYAATITYLGIEPSTFATKLADMRYAVKRAAGVPIIVGEAILTDIPEQAAASWDVAIAVAGTEIVLRVIGGRTQTVDWLVRGTVDVFAPEGLS